MDKILWIDKKKIFIICSGIALMLLISIPLLPPSLYRIAGGHDISFHLMRIEGLAEGLKMGQFPVKIQPAWYEGFGYGCSAFYGDLFLYIPACLRLLGVSLQTSYKLYVIMIQAGTLGITYYSLKGIFKEKRIAFVGTALYGLAVYRLMNIYVRGAVGEYTAMVFLPLLAYALVLLLGREHDEQNDSARKLRKGSLLLALSMTGILQSHILSAEMVCIVLGVICLVYIKRVFQARVFGAFAGAVCLTILLNLGFLVPFADYMLTGKFNVNAINGGWRVEQNIQDYGAFLSQLGQLFYSAGGSNQPRSLGAEGEMPIGVGLSLILALAVFAFLVVRLKKDEKQVFLWKLARISCFIAVLSLFMSTCYFPWEVLRKSNVLIRYLVINLQFPWRFCTVASVSLVMLWCCLFGVLWQHFKPNAMMTVAGVVLGMSALTAVCFMADVLREGQAFQTAFSQPEDTNVESGEEYLPVNAISKEFDEKNLYANPALLVTDFTREGIRLQFKCHNLSDEEQILEVPLIYYKGYRAWGTDETAGREDETGKREEMVVFSGNNQVVNMRIPAGFKGTIMVNFREPVYWRVAEAISLLTAAGIVMAIVRNIRKPFKTNSKRKQI